MSQRHASRIIPILLLALAAIELHGQAPALPPDSTLYTTYSGTYVELQWEVCGSTAQSSGCYGSGSLGPFTTIGAMLEGNPSVNGNVVTRAIYIVDAGANPMVLYVYTKTDTVTATSDVVSVTLSHTITLPLLGGTDVSAFMAANNSFLFIGSDFIGTGENMPVRIRKSDLHVARLDEFVGGTVAITSDQYGYVTVEQPGFFTVYGPNGEPKEDGGGDQFTLGTTQAMPGALLVGSPTAPAARR